MSVPMQCPFCIPAARKAPRSLSTAGKGLVSPVRLHQCVFNLLFLRALAIDVRGHYSSGIVVLRGGVQHGRALSDPVREL